MDFLVFLSKFIYRIRRWLIVVPIVAALVARYYAQKQQDLYTSKATVYTGIMTGASVDGKAVTNPGVTMENLLLVVKTECTVRETVFRLFVKCIKEGNKERNTNVITAANYRALVSQVPLDIIDVIEKNTEARAVEILKNDFYKEAKDNFLFGLFNYYHPFFCISAVTERISALRLGGSDLMEITYFSTDPGITYTTLKILNEEFIKQYQRLRFGESVDVIAYFRHQVDSSYQALNDLEAKLLRYNVKHGIINYGEQSRQIAIIDGAYLARLQSLIVDAATASDLIQFYTEHLDDQSARLLNNRELIEELDKFSKKNTERAMIDTYKTVDPNATATQRKVEDELTKSEDKLRDIVKKSIGTTNGVYNVKDQQLAMDWLNNVTTDIKTRAESGTMDTQRQMINKYIVNLSPVGVTIGHYERAIGFTEGYYTQMQNDLNQAILHQQNLRISTSSLHIMNDPLFPLHAEAKNVLMAMLTAALLAFILTFAFFLVVEMLDNTLRDRMRTERLTDEKVLGCYPTPHAFRFRRYKKIIARMARTQLMNTMNEFIKPGESKVINLISTDSKMGKRTLATLMKEEWEENGFQVRLVEYDTDFDVKSPEFQMATTIKDIVPDYNEKEILIVRYPSVHEVNIPSGLLNNASANILVCRADKAWKSSDRLSLTKIRKFLEKDTPLYIFLMNASRDAVEEFTGQLPPYTPYRNWLYRMLQFGLTERS